MVALLPLLISIVSTVHAASTPINPNCLDALKTKQVTHYMIPLLKSYNHTICDTIEGTCIYDKNGTQYMHNYGQADKPVSQERCKNGYGNQTNCLHPCRTLAASMKYHTFGEIVFIKELVGKKCGNLKRDGFEITHDGYMMVADTGAPSYFHAVGRFDFFWGRCEDQHSGECFEGAIPISDATSSTPFCTVWNPNHPKVNKALHDAFIKQVEAEDVLRKDFGAAHEIDAM